MQALRGCIAAWIAALAGLAARADEGAAPIPARAVVFSPDGMLLAVGFGTREVGGGLVIWNVDQQRPLQVIKRDPGVSTIAFSPDGQLLALSIYDHAPEVVEVASGELYATLAESRRGPVAFSPDGLTLATGSDDKRIGLWDVKLRSDRQVLAGAKDRIYGCMQFSSDGSLLLSPCGGEGVYVWDLGLGRPRHILKHSSFFNRAGLFSPDGKWIVTGGWDGTTRVWNTETGEERARFTGTGGVDQLAFSDRAKLLALAAGGRDVRLFSLSFDATSDETRERIGRLLRRFDDDSYAEREAASRELVQLGFEAEAELQRVASDSPSAEWRIRARRARQAILSQPTAVLSGHRGKVESVAFAPSGKWLASGSEDGTVRIWDIAERREVTRFTPADVGK
jgi:WD40 repeat protein